MLPFMPVDAAVVVAVRLVEASVIASAPPPLLPVDAAVVVRVALVEVVHTLNSYGLYSYGPYSYAWYRHRLYRYGCRSPAHLGSHTMLASHHDRSCRCGRDPRG